MANWKKVIVSGSNANLTQLQVDNLTSGQVVIGGGASNLSTTAINGTGTIVATTAASGLSHSGSFSGSFQGNGSGLTNVAASSLTNALTIGEGLGGAASYNGSAAVTLTVSGAADLTNNIITKWNNTDNKFAPSSITDDGTTVSGATSVRFTGASSSLTGSFTGSFVGDGAGLTGLISTLNINAGTGGPSTVALASQTLTIDGTANEVETSVSGQTITVGLPNNVTIGNNLTVTGDLFVNGTTTTINTQDLYVEDKFIVLASGSAASGDAGIIVDRGSDANLNIAFGFDADTDRWGFQNGLTDSTNAMTIGTNGNSAFAGLVFTETAHTSTKPTSGEFVKEGAIYTATDGTIWMYA
jgi:hypothetical protein